jgi:GDPmannose 4,6-dehydratase
VKYDSRYERPAEVELLIGSYAKAKEKLGWEPKTRFQDLVRIMVDGDLAMIDGGKLPEPDLEVLAALERARAEEMAAK